VALRITVWFVILCLAAGPLMASKFYSQDDLIIAGSRVIDDDVYALTNTCEFAGTINGDFNGLIFDIEMVGDIDGNLNLVTWRADAGGNITKSLRIIGWDVDIASEIEKDLLILGRKINVSRRAEIGRDVTLIGDLIYVDGTIEGDLDIWGEIVIIDGEIKGDVRVEADEITLARNTTIEGNLHYTSFLDIFIEDDALVAGRITHSIPELGQPEIEYALNKIFLVGRIIFFAMTLFTGLFIILVFRTHSRETSNYILDHFPASVGLGLLALIIFTLGAIILFAIVIGIPLAVFLVFLAIFLMFAGQIYCATAIGRGLLRLLGNRDIALGWAFLIGYIILIVIFSIPIFGIVIYTLVFLIGTGGAIGGFYTMCKKCRQSDTPSPEAASGPESATDISTP
jgi:cytoskeletal protein CcmA (bactofilin family)